MVAATLMHCSAASHSDDALSHKVEADTAQVAKEDVRALYLALEPLQKVLEERYFQHVLANNRLWDLRPLEELGDRGRQLLGRTRHATIRANEWMGALVESHGIYQTNDLRLEAIPAPTRERIHLFSDVWPVGRKKTREALELAHQRSRSHVSYWNNYQEPMGVYAEKLHRDFNLMLIETWIYSEDVKPPLSSEGMRIDTRTLWMLLASLWSTKLGERAHNNIGTVTLPYSRHLASLDLYLQGDPQLEETKAALDEVFTQMATDLPSKLVEESFGPEQRSKASQALMAVFQRFRERHEQLLEPNPPADKEIEAAFGTQGIGNSSDLERSIQQCFDAYSTARKYPVYCRQQSGEIRFQSCVLERYCSNKEAQSCHCYGH